MCRRFRNWAGAFKSSGNAKLRTLIRYAGYWHPCSCAGDDLKPDISEFSYGYAVTEEIVTSCKAIIVGAPIFPSLYEEGKVGGYDVQIPIKGRPLFLQFKLSDYLLKRSAKEYQDGLLTMPYYRMHIRPLRHSEQHDLLRALESAGESVFYISPEFHLPEELNDYYLRKVVVNNSAAFSPNEIGVLPDDGPHYVAFKRGASIAYRRSDEAVEIAKRSLKDGLQPFLDAAEIQIRELGEKGLRTINMRMLNAIEAAEVRFRMRDKTFDVEGVRRIISDREPIVAAGYMARTFFDSELLILPV